MEKETKIYQEAEFKRGNGRSHFQLKAEFSYRLPVTRHRAVQAYPVFTGIIRSLWE